MDENKILEVKNLNVSFNTYAGTAYAVRGIDFYLNKGENLAIVGESGCGKTVTAKSIMGLLPKPQAVVGKEGSAINFDGGNLLEYGEDEMAEIRGKEISMIFQDPMTSLNPTMKVGEQIEESVLLHNDMSRSEISKVALDMMELVRMPNAKIRLNQYPFEFSGGMRQRAMIAIALACNPKILIADEPTTALDVTIQAQIMDLIGSLQKDLDTGVILVTHDLGVVASVADRIQVMYAGKIVETGTVREIFYSPKHPYTFALLKSVPKLTTASKESLYSLSGTPPDLINPPIGCPFAARCEFGMSVCRVKHPDTTKFSETQKVSCWLHDKRADTSGVPEELLQRGVNYGK